MALPDGQGETSIWDVLRDEVQDELDQLNRELKEISLMLEQGNFLQFAI
jgi:hypothetical protein